MTEIKMTRELALQLLNTYGKAWETRDPDLIITIFTPDATYNDPKEPLNHGHAGIQAYWRSKVIGEQKDIKFNLLHVWIDSEPSSSSSSPTVIAEWHATFIDTKRNVGIDMKEVAIFGTTNGKFSSLREYYKAVKIPIDGASSSSSSKCQSSSSSSSSSSSCGKKKKLNRGLAVLGLVTLGAAIGIAGVTALTRNKSK